jgi:hypothetical protein
MARTVIWRSPCNGRQHLATLSGNPDEGYQLKAVCGLASSKVRFTEILTDGEVTCPACKSEVEIATLVRYLAA